MFTPPAGSVTVAPGACSAPICMTIPRPPGLTAHNATACYAVSIVNDATGTCYTKQATIRNDNCGCATPAQQGVVNVAARVAAGTEVGIGIEFPCGPIAAMPYRVSAVWLNTEHPDPQALSLNGLPPGTPVTGTLSVGPLASTPLSVQASYPDGYDPAAPYEIVFEADTDGDAVMERLCGTIVASTYDSAQVTSVTPVAPPSASLRLLATPNPFMGGSSISFSLATAEDVTLGIYDLNGRLVRSLQRGRLTAGAYRFEWNGRDANGRRAAAGVYFARLEAGARRLQSQLVKLR